MKVPFSHNRGRPMSKKTPSGGRERNFHSGKLHTMFFCRRITFSANGMVSLTESALKEPVWNTGIRLVYIYYSLLYYFTRYAIRSKLLQPWNNRAGKFYGQRRLFSPEFQVFLKNSCPQSNHQPRPLEDVGNKT